MPDQPAKQPAGDDDKAEAELSEIRRQIALEVLADLAAQWAALLWESENKR